MKSTHWKIVSSDYVGSDSQAQALKVEFPFYMQTYTEALGAVLKNISYNQRMYQEKRRKGSAFIGEGSGFIDLDESNLFAFIGDRGSGKTTALYEFCKILRHYHEERDKWSSEIKLRPDNTCDVCRFHVLEPIDASVLGAKEDLLEVILASMYRVFQQKVKSNKVLWSSGGSVQDLANCFDAVYKAYVNMGNLKEQKISGEAVLARLMDTSSSLKTKEEMEKLISNFLSFLDEKGDDGKSYLVVTIDDLDLNLRNGYEMLEQLHKYLANQHVIVLITVHYEQMKMICEKHIVDCLVPEFGGIHWNLYEKFDERAWKISNDYLLKVLPLANRVYLPEGSQVYKRAQICLDKDGKTVNWDIKKFVLKKLALQMNIFYDAKGLKTHFCLPSTVRELVTYDDFLESLIPMEQIEREMGRRRQLYDQNHERFSEDIEKRMALQVLNYDQLQLFRRIMKRDIKRRAQYAVNFLSLRMGHNDGYEKESMEEDKEKGDKGSETKHDAMSAKMVKGYKNEGNRAISSDGNFCLRDDVDDQNYCYADLLEVLYTFGRHDYDNKPLVHCLLASFTSEMVREYYSFRVGNTVERSVSRDRLAAFLGRTFGGRWFDNNSVRMEILEYSEGMKENQDLSSTDQNRIKVGYIEDGFWGDKKIVLQISAVTQNSLEEREFIQGLAECVPYLECLTLCFTDFKDSEENPASGNWKFTLKGNDGKVQLEIENEAHYAVFDAFGFIGKEITGLENGSKDVTVIHRELTKKLAEAAKNYFGDTARAFEVGEEQFEKELSESIEKRSLWHQVMNEHECAFPYYDLDLSYNVMKRVRKRIKKGVRLQENSIYNYYRTIYGYMAEELWKEQAYYEELLGIGTAWKFFDNFVNSPFIRAFGIRCEDDRLQEEGVLEADQRLTREGTLDRNMLETVFYQAVKGLSLNREITVDMREQEMV